MSFASYKLQVLLCFTGRSTSHSFTSTQHIASERSVCDTDMKLIFELWNPFCSCLAAYNGVEAHSRQKNWGTGQECLVSEEGFKQFGKFVSITYSVQMIKKTWIELILVNADLFGFEPHWKTFFFSTHPRNLCWWWGVSSCTFTL